jgi:hypothetical protein
MATRSFKRSRTARSRYCCSPDVHPAIAAATRDTEIAFNARQHEFVAAAARAGRVCRKWQCTGTKNSGPGLASEQGKWRLGRHERPKDVWAGLPAERACAAGKIQRDKAGLDFKRSRVACQDSQRQYRDVLARLHVEEVKVRRSVEGRSTTFSSYIRQIRRLGSLADTVAERTEPYAAPLGSGLFTYAPRKISSGQSIQRVTL